MVSISLLMTQLSNITSFLVPLSTIVFSLVSCGFGVVGVACNVCDGWELHVRLGPSTNEQWLCNFYDHFLWIAIVVRSIVLLMLTTCRGFKTESRGITALAWRCVLCLGLVGREKELSDDVAAGATGASHVLANFLFALLQLIFVRI